MATDQGGSDLLRGIRALSGPVFVIGGWQVTTLSFGWGLFIVYFGFLLCFAECIWEPLLLSRSYALQVILMSVLFVVVGIFTIEVAIVRAPLVFSTLGSRIDYSLPNSPTAPGGIPWRPFYTELDVTATNPTDENYDNVDLFLRPDSSVAALAELTNLPGVSFQNKQGMEMRLTAEVLGTNEKTNGTFLATNDGYKVHCPRIPPHSSLAMVMAIVAIKRSAPMMKMGAPIQIPNTASTDDLFVDIVTTSKDGTFHYWYGSPRNTAIYLPNPKPLKVLVSALYTAANHRRGTTEDVTVWWGKNE